MKRNWLLIICLFVFTTSIYSQTFTTTSGVSSGIEIDAQGNFTQVQGTLNIEPTLTLEENFTVSAVGLALFKEDLPKFYVGSELGYVFWKNTPQKTTLAITGRYLYGSAGAQLIGTGLNYNVDKTTIGAKGDWNYQDKTALLTLEMSYLILY